MTEPIRPEQVAQAKTAQIPAVVLVVFNELITKAWDGRTAVVRQDEIVETILDRDTSLTRGEIFDGHLLDVEPIYRDAGWGVEYDKPGFNESYEPVFTFSVPRKS